jgi:hypothetical protein
MGMNGATLCTSVRPKLCMCLLYCRRTCGHVGYNVGGVELRGQPGHLLLLAMDSGGLQAVSAGVSESWQTTGGDAVCILARHASINTGGIHRWLCILVQTSQAYIWGWKVHLRWAHHLIHLYSTFSLGFASADASGLT